MKKNIITIFVIALSFSVFAQQNDTMFIHMGQTVLELPTAEIDSIIFYRIQPAASLVAGSSCRCLQPCKKLSLDTEVIVQSERSCYINDDCVSCGWCVLDCPVGAIFPGNGKYQIAYWICIDCASCASACPVEAIVGGNCGSGGGNPPPTKRCDKRYFEWGPIYG
jgi:Fe-S-cluster-containing hydrogenase component 2